MNVEENKINNIYPQIIPRLDRTPRSGKDARIYTNNSPKKFKASVENVLKSISNKDYEHRVMFLQAWNEWGEGNYMEPDLKFGNEFIDALREVIVDENDEV